MAEIQDRELSCPRCGAPMSRGFINAGKGPMRWVIDPKQNKTILGGDRLVKQHWVWGRHVVPAARCEHCKIGIFVYE
jgi:DNA-directed RNA polymerase subunit RPC12/RpoP